MAGLFSSDDLVELSGILEHELGLKLRGEDLVTAAVAITRFTCATMIRQKKALESKLNNDG